MTIAGRWRRFEWGRLLRDPRSEKALERLLGEADAEIARGEVGDTDPRKGMRSRTTRKLHDALPPPVQLQAKIVYLR